MNDLKRTLPWLVAALAGGLLVAWAFPRLFPLYPRDWTVTASEAEAITLERIRDLPDLTPGPRPDLGPEGGGVAAGRYVVTDVVTDTGLLERRLLLAGEAPGDSGGDAGASGRVAWKRLRESGLGRRIFAWRVTVYEPGALPGEWTYRAEIAPGGGLTSLRHKVDPGIAAEPIEIGEAIVTADAFLELEGFDLEDYERPVARSREVEARTDLELRYRSKEAVLGEELRYGLAVHFAGDQLVGFDSWHEDGSRRSLQEGLQAFGVWNQLQFLGVYLAALLVAAVFLRRYHAGEVGVRRAVHVFLLGAGAALVVVVLIASAQTEGGGFGVFTRRQITWVWGLQFLVLFFGPHALVAFLSWSVGESLCREGWSRKLAAFDALFQGRWDNATVARAALRGPAAGVALLGGLLGVALLSTRFGAWPQVTFLLDELWLASPLPGLSLLALSVVVVLYRELFGRLFLVPVAVRGMGSWAGGAVVALVTGLFVLAPFHVLPLAWGLVLAVAVAAALVALFLVYDLLTVLLASGVLQVALGALPLVLSSDLSYQIQGWLALAVPALPAALSIRYLGSGREFVYRWDDVPPHVRRIADRERQRVELETARRIQSSILPDLPPRLAGVDLAHAYLPATEVGGDFYDVLALEDGRLAVAVGDVAGHGVSSGLVMSAVKSALTVQASFDPEVRAVFTTLNRMVYQSARRRLITTLCYALVDPRERRLLFASAGHIYPYLLRPGQRKARGDGGGGDVVEVLTSTAYPLGVRPDLDVVVASRELAAGDTLVLLSDGIVEARPEGSSDVYGFTRLERTLGSLSGEPVERVRDGLLQDLARFVGPSPREDDQTVLVLRLP